MGCTPALETILDTVRQNSSQEIAAAGEQAIVSILGAVADGEARLKFDLLTWGAFVAGSLFGIFKQLQPPSQAKLRQGMESLFC